MSSIRWRLKFAAGVLGTALVGLAVINYCRVFHSAPVELTLSGGNVCPLRTTIARYIADEIHDAGVAVRCVADTNSESIGHAVNEHRLELGIVLGGFAPERFPNVRQVAALGVEPLHLLVRRELVTSSRASLELLRGRRVAIGEYGTNGAILAESLMRFAGFAAATPGTKGDFIAEYTTEPELHLQLAAVRCAAPKDRPAFAAKLPDAVFLVDHLPSPLVDELVATGGYALVPLPYATALHLDSRREHAHAEGPLENSRLEAVTIPAFTYGVAPPVPDADCPTIGLRLLLVAHQDTAPEAVTRLLRALDDGVTRRYHIELDTANLEPEFPLHAGAAAFADARRPLLAAELLEPAGDLLSILGAGAAGGLALWGFVRGLRRVNPDVHLRQIDRIERLLHGREQDDAAPTLPRDFVAYLETRLAEVKQTAIEDYTAGRLDGEQALVTILTLITDTRHLLTQRRKQLGQQESAVPPRPNRFADAA